MMLSPPRPIPGLDGGAAKNNSSSSRPKRRRSSALGIFLRRQSSSLIDEPFKASSTFLADLPVDDSTLTASVSSVDDSVKSSLREAAVSKQRSASDATRSIKSCLKYKTQIASLQHVFAHSSSSSKNEDPEESKDQEEGDTAQAQAPPPSVHFGSIAIHSHGILLGDNPAVSNGPPVTIEWTCFDTVLESVDRWEAEREAAGNYEPRQGPELLLPPRLRQDLIQRGGVNSRQEIAQQLRATGRIRARRQRTAQRALATEAWRRRWNRLRGKETNNKLNIEM